MSHLPTQLLATIAVLLTGTAPSAAGRQSVQPTGTALGSQPELLSITLRDGGRDGRFEPGEALAVEVEVGNPAGAGRVELRLEGEALVLEHALAVELSGAGATTTRRLAVLLDPTLSPGSCARLTLVVGERRRELWLPVSASRDVDEDAPLRLTAAPPQTAEQVASGCRESADGLLMAVRGPQEPDRPGRELAGSS